MKVFPMIIMAFCFFFTVSAVKLLTISADDVKGTYWNAEKTAKIRIYRAKNDKYYGKIEFLKEPNDKNGNPKKDPNNPNEKLRDRDRLGMVIMQGFEWNAKEKKWEGGTIYDPSEGKTYDGYMYFDEENLGVLNLRGYVMGMTWLGRTSQWQRIN